MDSTAHDSSPNDAQPVNSPQGQDNQGAAVEAPTVPLAPGLFVMAPPNSRNSRSTQRGRNGDESDRSRSRLRSHTVYTASISDILEAQEALSDTDTSSRDRHDAARLRKQLDSLQATLESMRVDHAAALKKASEQYDILLSLTRTQEDRNARQMMQLCQVLIVAMGDDADKVQLIKTAFNDVVPLKNTQKTTVGASSVTPSPSIIVQSSDSEAEYMDLEQG